MDGYEWSELLQSDPSESTVEQCDKEDGWSDMDMFDLMELLSEQPCFAARCPYIDTFNDVTWNVLVNEQPELEKYRKTVENPTF